MRSLGLFDPRVFGQTWPEPNRNPNVPYIVGLDEPLQGYEIPWTSDPRYTGRYVTDLMGDEAVTSRCPCSSSQRSPHVVGRSGLVGRTPGVGAWWGGDDNPKVDTKSGLVAWFEKKQQQAWCELYPHLLKLMAAGSKAATLGAKFRYEAAQPANALDNGRLLFLANESDTLARDVRKAVDMVYAVKDYVLGGNFGAEGWKYEKWCKDNGYSLKSINQIQQEAARSGFAGMGALGIEPVTLAVAGLTIGAVLAYIVYAVAKSAELSRDYELTQQAIKSCDSGNSNACDTARRLVDSRIKTREQESKGPTDNLATVAIWGGAAVLALVGYKVWSSRQVA